MLYYSMCSTRGIATTDEDKDEEVDDEAEAAAGEEDALLLPRLHHDQFVSMDLEIDLEMDLKFDSSQQQEQGTFPFQQQEPEQHSQPIDASVQLQWEATTASDDWVDCADWLVGEGARYDDASAVKDEDDSDLGDWL
jgi:hypothetical protein